MPEVATRRQTVPLNEKRRKPRRQSGMAVQFANKESVVQRSRLERTDSDKVIRRKSMERKMSNRNSLKLPQDFLDGLKRMDESLRRRSLAGSVRGLRPHELEQLGMEDISENSANGGTYTEEQIREMSKQALEMSDSDSEGSVELDLEVPLQLEDIEE
jgi:hypothetical protein